MSDSTPITAAYNKTQLLNELAESTGVPKQDVANVLEGLSNIIERHVKKGSCGMFTMPGLFKVQTTHKPATEARMGINPFTKEETMFKAKPAQTSIKIRPLKGMKDMV